MIYDRFFPLTLGGAERLMVDRARGLEARGHDVTYVTARHWNLEASPQSQELRVVALGPRLEAYGERRRRFIPPIVFGLAVFLHLLRHGRSYDVVHSVAFPYFPLLAAGVLRRLIGYRLVVDWVEVWTHEYWLNYAGRLAGRLGWIVQRLAIALTPQAFCLTRLHARRLRSLGYRGRISIVQGVYDGPFEPSAAGKPPTVVFAGRLIPEKRAGALIPAIAIARRAIPELRCLIFGEGPQRAVIERSVAAAGLADAISLPGFVPDGALKEAMARALCLVLPSEREGFGLVIIEAAARGTPSVVTASPDSASVELIEQGENGFVVPSASADDLAAAFERTWQAGNELRTSTAQWFSDQGKRFFIENSLGELEAAYAAHVRNS